MHAAWSNQRNYTPCRTTCYGERRHRAFLPGCAFFARRTIEKHRVGVASAVKITPPPPEFAAAARIYTLLWYFEAEGLRDGRANVMGRWAWGLGPSRPENPHTRAMQIRTVLPRGGATSGPRSWCTKEIVHSGGRKMKMDPPLYVTVCQVSIRFVFTGLMNKKLILRGLLSNYICTGSTWYLCFISLTWNLTARYDPDVSVLDSWDYFYFFKIYERHLRTC
jgi:hypothetical protein